MHYVRLSYAARQADGVWEECHIHLSDNHQKYAQNRAVVSYLINLVAEDRYQSGLC